METLDNWASVGLETEFSHVGSHACVTKWRGNLNSGAQTHFLDRWTSMRVAGRQHRGGAVCWGQRQLRAQNPPRMSCASHPLGDVGLCPFPLINSCECHGFNYAPWILGVLLVNWKAEGRFGSPLNFQLVSEGKAVLETLPSNLTVWILLGILSDHFRRLSNMPSVSKLMKDGAGFHSPDIILLWYSSAVFTLFFFLLLISHVKFFQLK